MRFLGSILLTLFVFTALRADVVRPGTFQGRSDGSTITLSWVTDDESSVLRFEVERRIGTTGDFGYIATVSPKGPSLYEFVDHSAFKVVSTLYQYRIKVVFEDNSAIYVGPVTVSHSVSGVKRTWGSIKAMFR